MAFNGAYQSDLLTNSSLSVGTIINGIQAGGQVGRDVTMVNNLSTFAPGTFSTFGGNEYHRTNNFNLSNTVAIATDDIATSGGGLAFGSNGGGAIVSLTLPAGYTFLVAAYDGPNGGVIVWDIASLAVGTVIEMPRYAYPSGAAGSQLLLQNDPSVQGDNEQYQMTGWTLLKATTGTPFQTVPDGGSAIALLGIALIGLEALRRKLRTA